MYPFELATFIALLNSLQPISLDCRLQPFDTTTHPRPFTPFPCPPPLLTCACTACLLLVCFSSILSRVSLPFAVFACDWPSEHDVTAALNQHEACMSEAITAPCPPWRSYSDGLPICSCFGTREGEGVYICVSVSVCVCVCLCLFVCVCVCLSVWCEEHPFSATYPSGSGDHQKFTAMLSSGKCEQSSVGNDST